VAKRDDVVTGQTDFLEGEKADVAEVGVGELLEDVAGRRALDLIDELLGGLALGKHGGRRFDVDGDIVLTALVVEPEPLRAVDSGPVELLLAESEQRPISD
jgi:hypothetical protein